MKNRNLQTRRGEEEPNLNFSLKTFRGKKGIKTETVIISQSMQQGKRKNKYQPISWNLFHLHREDGWPVCQKGTNPANEKQRSSSYYKIDCRKLLQHTLHQNSKMTLFFTYELRIDERFRVWSSLGLWGMKLKLGRCYGVRRSHGNHRDLDF